MYTSLYHIVNQGIDHHPRALSLRTFLGMTDPKWTDEHVERMANDIQIWLKKQPFTKMKRVRTAVSLT
jgi:hypothetical protein